MGKLSWFNKVFYLFTGFVCVTTLVGFVLPYLAPKLFPVLSVVTLVLPSLLVFNLFLLFYWAVQLKKQVLVPLVVVLIGLSSSSKFYKFGGQELKVEQDDLTIMSYNVRLFNLFEWFPESDVSERIQEFIQLQDPDVVCLQEYSTANKFKLSAYKYSFKTSRGKNIKTGQAIYSKYQIIDKGEINLPNSNNNVVFVDLLKNKDTIRIYSMHLQSVNISPDIHERIDEVNSKRILNRLSKAFKEQQLQSELLQGHAADITYPKIICGDMNNSSFSYVYRNIRGDLSDAFVEAGSGFGATYHFPYYPARIDYIFVDKRFEVRSFKTYDDFVKSDHYPIVTTLRMREL